MTPLVDADILDEVEYKEGGLYWVKPRRGRTVGRRVGTVNSAGYRHFTYNFKIHNEHKIIWFMFNGAVPKGKIIDHKDRNSLNNNIDNLRLVTPKGNQENQLGKGYSINARGKRYRARVVVDGKPIYLGNFDTKEEAHMAYLKGKRELHQCFSETGVRDDATN